MVLPAANAVPKGADTDRHWEVRARVEAGTAPRYEIRWLEDQYTFWGKRAGGWHDPDGREQRTADAHQDALAAEAEERLYQATRPRAVPVGDDPWWPHPDATQ